MNKQRAVEVILEDTPVEGCPVCHGSGLVPFWTGPLTGIVDPDDPCKLCNGYGHRLRGEYLQACVVLHRPFPKQ